MSYCKIVLFRDGLPYDGIEFRNAWGGSARIWDSLFKKYLKDPSIEYDSWLANSDRTEALWKLASRDDIPAFERAVHAFTFDLFYVAREHFHQIAEDLRSFVREYPVSGRVDHLTAWAEAIEKTEAEAVGLYGTSVAENLWYKYDEEKDDEIPVSIDEGWEVYDWMNSEHAQPA